MSGTNETFMTDHTINQPFGLLQKNPGQYLLTGKNNYSLPKGRKMESRELLHFYLINSKVTDFAVFQSEGVISV